MKNQESMKKVRGTGKERTLAGKLKWTVRLEVIHGQFRKQLITGDVAIPVLNQDWILGKRPSWPRFGHIPPIGWQEAENLD